MDSLRNYNVDFVKLKPGQHDLTFEINDDFFGLKEHSLVDKGQVSVLLHIDKKERLMTFTFTIKGTVEVICDVCLDPLLYPVQLTESQIIKIEEEPPSGDDDIVYLRPHETFWNIYDHLYEMICICIPMAKTCKDNAGGPKECNPAMLKYLAEGQEDQSENETTDPRWDKLKNINK